MLFALHGGSQLSGGEHQHNSGGEQALDPDACKHKQNLRQNPAVFVEIDYIFDFSDTPETIAS